MQAVAFVTHTAMQGAYNSIVKEGAAAKLTVKQAQALMFDSAASSLATNIHPADHPAYIRAQRGRLPRPGTDVEMPVSFLHEGREVTSGEHLMTLV